MINAESGSEKYLTLLSNGAVSITSDTTQSSHMRSFDFIHFAHSTHDDGGYNISCAQDDKRL